MEKNINKDILSIIDKPDLLFDVLKNNYKDSNLNKNILFRCLYNLSEIDISKAAEIVNLINNKYDDISYLAIKIKILSSKKLIENALEVLQNIPEKKRKKRLLIPIFNSLCELNYDHAFNFLENNLYNKFRLYEEDIKCIYKYITNKDFETFLKIIASNEIIINDIKHIGLIKNLENYKVVNLAPNYECTNCKKNLIKLNFNIYLRQKLINNLESEYLKNKKHVMTPLNNIIVKNNYNIFIDGNNVLFFIDRSITINGYKRLETIFNKASLHGNVLITLHQRHRDKIKKNLSKTNFKIASKILDKLKNNIFYTPYNMNDDWFFIWAGINTIDSLVITNDLLRDHIKNISEENIISNTLSRWINEYVVRYDFSSTTNVVLNFPSKISIKIQNNDGIWHLPTKNGKWICQNTFK